MPHNRNILLMQLVLLCNGLQVADEWSLSAESLWDGASRAPAIPVHFTCIHGVKAPNICT